MKRIFKFTLLSRVIEFIYTYYFIIYYFIKERLSSLILFMNVKFVLNGTDLLISMTFPSNSLSLCNCLQLCLFGVNELIPLDWIPAPMTEYSTLLKFFNALLWPGETIVWGQRPAPILSKFYFFSDRVCFCVEWMRLTTNSETSFVVNTLDIISL